MFASHRHVCVYEGYVPPCYHSHLFIKLRYTRGRPSVLSFASVHKCCVTRGRPSVLQSHLIIALHEGHVPPCYHSHLFIMLRYTKGTSLRAIIRISSCCVTRNVLRAIIRICSSCCVTRGNVPPCYHSHLIIMLRYTRERPSVTIIRICSYVALHESTSLRAIIRICSSFALHEGVLRAIIRICS
jgi:hypothetical protein